MGRYWTRRTVALTVLLAQLRMAAWFGLADALSILPPQAHTLGSSTSLPSTTLFFFGPQAFRLNTSGAPLVTLDSAMTARLCDETPPWPAAMRADDGQPPHHSGGSDGNANDAAAFVTGAVVLLDMSVKSCGFERVYAHLHAARALAVLEGGYYTRYPGAMWMARDEWGVRFRGASLVWLSVSRDLMFEAIRSHRSARALSGAPTTSYRVEEGSNESSLTWRVDDIDGGDDRGNGDSGVRVDVDVGFILEPTPNFWRRLAEGAAFTLVVRVGFAALALAAGTVALRNLRARQRCSRGTAPSSSESDNATRSPTRSSFASGLALPRGGRSGIVWSAITVVLAVEVGGRVRHGVRADIYDDCDHCRL